MALKTSVVVLLSFNLLFFATLSSSSALPPAAPAPQPSSCPIDIRDLRVCGTTLVAFVYRMYPYFLLGRNKIDQCCAVIRSVEAEANVCICGAIKAGVLQLPSNIRDMAEPLSNLRKLCGVGSNLECA